HGELAGRGQCAIGHHGKDQAFHRSGKATSLQEIVERAVDAQLPPKGIEEVWAAQLFGAEVFERPVQIELFLKGLDFPGLKEPTDAFHQAPEGIKIDLVLRSEEHTSELQSRENLVCRLLLEKKKVRKDGPNCFRS